MNNNYWNQTCKIKNCNQIIKPLSDYCPPHSKEKDVYMTQDAGFRGVIKLIQSRGIRILESHELNKNRYVLTKTENKTYFICYKRDFFNSFGKIFEKEGEVGVGETVNVEDLKPVFERVTDLVFVYQDGRIYSISKEDFMEYSYRRVTDAEGKVVRSFSVRYLKDFEKELI